MGRTIPSFRRGAEIERAKWNLFRQELDKSERKMFGLQACVTTADNHL